MFLSYTSRFPEQDFVVGWYIEPSQPQRITSGLKTNFNLSPSYSAYKSSNHIFSNLQKNYVFTQDLPAYDDVPFSLIWLQKEQKISTDMVESNT